MPVHQLNHRTGAYTIGGIVQPELGRSPRDLPSPTSVPEPTPLVQHGLEQSVLSGEVELGFAIRGGVHTALPAREISPDDLSDVVRCFESHNVAPLQSAFANWRTPSDAEECDFGVRGIWILLDTHGTLTLG